MGSDLRSGPNAAQKWANVLFAGTNIEQIVNLSQLLGDCGCFNEELLPDVIHCGSKVCVSGPQGSERGKNKKNQPSFHKTRLVADPSQLPSFLRRLRS